MFRVKRNSYYKDYERSGVHIKKNAPLMCCTLYGGYPTGPWLLIIIGLFETKQL